MKEQEVIMAGGVASSSKIPRLELIPTEANIRLADRFELGIERKADKAWNALSNNQSCLTDKDFILNRIGHVIHHANKLRDKILRGAPMEGDDDAGALAWSGAFLCCATKALADAKPLLNCSACGGTGILGGASVNGESPVCPACRGTGKERPRT